MNKDIVIFGAAAGIVGNTVKTILALILYYLGHLEKTYIHISSGYFATANHQVEPISIINGLFSDFIYAGFLGVIIYLIIIKTNTNYIFLKGIFIGGFIHVLNNGILFFSVLNKVTITDSLTYLLLIISNIFFGIITCLFIKKYKPA